MKPMETNHASSTDFIAPASRLTRLGRALRWLGTGAVALGLAAAPSCGGVEQQGSDSSSHWLEGCMGDTDCGGLTCVCGVCTTGCSQSSDCDGRDVPSTCSSLASWGCSEGASACLATCATDADCSSIRGGLSCVGGACVPGSDLPNGSSMDASAGGALVSTGGAHQGVGGSPAGGAFQGTGGSPSGGAFQSSGGKVSQGSGGAAVGAGGAFPSTGGGVFPSAGGAITGTGGGTGGQASPEVCTDAIQNGSETDVDCGGVCSPCTAGRQCLVGTDCTASICTASICQLASCVDGVLNGDEEAVDCGGPTCSPCSTNCTCASPSDCASHVCVACLCMPPSCTDAVKNGTETDVDCGGVSCPPCSLGMACIVGPDCTSGVCNGSLCMYGADGASPD